MALFEKVKILASTRSTPEVILDSGGTIKLTGRLISENPMDFFIPIEKWIDEYFLMPADITCVEICFEYINSVGSKFLLHMLHKITHVYLKNKTNRFVINWYCKDEDEDMLEKGTFFSSNLGVPFNFIRII
jgi:hypothetical protein